MDIFAPRLLILMCLLTLVMHHEKCTMNKKHLQLKTTRNIVSHNFFKCPFYGNWTLVDQLTMILIQILVNFQTRIPESRCAIKNIKKVGKILAYKSQKQIPTGETLKKILYPRNFVQIYKKKHLHIFWPKLYNILDIQDIWIGFAWPNPYKTLSNWMVMDSWTFGGYLNTQIIRVALASMR